MATTAAKNARAMFVPRVAPAKVVVNLALGINVQKSVVAITVANIARGSNAQKTVVARTVEIIAWRTRHNNPTD